MSIFNFFEKKQKGSVLEINIDGMHCTSCSMNIDGELEDLEGIISATTSYAKQKCVVEFDSKKINREVIESTIKKLGYQIK